jgi:ribonuclease HI
MTVIIQEETTGCGIASVANIVDQSYAEVKAKANAMNIFANDNTLYSDTQYVRNLLRKYDVQVSNNEIPFKSWEALPDIALLSIKYHEENGLFFWHWVVFKREQGASVVLDSAAYLKENKRIDFQNMKPKWFIEVSKT